MHNHLVLSAILVSIAACSSSGSDNSAGAGGSSGPTTSSPASSGSGGASSSSSGTSSSTSSASAGGGGGMGGAGGGGPACNWSPNSNPCNANQYCLSADCMTGVCTDIPAANTEIPDMLVVCGCDGNRYWNSTVAATHGMPVDPSKVLCAGKTCGGFANIQCPMGLDCDFEGPDQQICQTSDVGGVCMGVLTMCAGGPESLDCQTNMCTDECALIKSGKTFYSGGCPK